MPHSCLVDSHCHLDLQDCDPGLVVARARAAGVGGMLTVSIKLSAFESVLHLAKAHENVWCSVGVHPHMADSEGEVGTAERLCALAQHAKVVALGECGLDFYRNNATPQAQELSFREHCHAARHSGLPIIVHSRSADKETADILRSECSKGPLSGVLHCFSGGRELAETAIGLGFYVSFSGILTFKTSDDLRAIAADLPLERILLETDAPYLAPVPHRGQRNEPAFIVHTARRASEVFGLPFDRVASATTANFFRLFSKASSSFIEVT